MHVLFKNNVATYPYSAAHLRRDNPGTSFPADMSDATLAEWNVYPVAAAEPPSFNPLTERREEAAPVVVAGVWRQAWNVTALSPEEITAATDAWRQSITITPLQARRALRAAGLLGAVSAYMATQSEEAQEAWEYCVEVRRDDPMILGAGAALGVGEAQMDGLFRTAALL